VSAAGSGEPSGGADAAVMNSRWFAVASDAADVGATAPPVKNMKTIASATIVEGRPKGARVDHDG
jgi:hypothetical protein